MIDGFYYGNLPGLQHYGLDINCQTRTKQLSNGIGLKAGKQKQRRLMKLHIGGEEAKEGWKILNIQNKPHVDFIGNVSDLSQFGDQTIDEIYASHVIEHVPEKMVLQTLKGIHRVLKSRGKFYVSVPDLDILCQMFMHPAAKPAVKWQVMRIMFGGQLDAHDYHYVGWNQVFMWDFLKLAGFSSAERVESFGMFNDTSEYKPYGFPISLNVIATK